MDQKEKFYSTEQVAQIFGVTRRAVQHWIHKGLLPGSERRSPLPGSGWKIPQSAIDHFEALRQAATKND